MWLPGTVPVFGARVVKPSMIRGTWPIPARSSRERRDAARAAWCRMWYAGRDCSGGLTPADGAPDPLAERCTCGHLWLSHEPRGGRRAVCDLCAHQVACRAGPRWLRVVFA